MFEEDLDVRIWNIRKALKLKQYEIVKNWPGTKSPKRKILLLKNSSSINVGNFNSFFPHSNNLRLFLL